MRFLILNFSYCCPTLYTHVFSTTSPARTIQKQTFKIITTSFRDFYSVPFVYFHLVYMRFENCILNAPKTKPSLFRAAASSLTQASTFKCRPSNPQSTCTTTLCRLQHMAIYPACVTRHSHRAKLSHFEQVPPRDARLIQRVTRLLLWRLNTIISSASGIFGSLSYRIINRLAKSMSLIASQTNANLNRIEHEQCTLFDSMSGDLADALASVFPRFVIALCFI